MNMRYPCIHACENAQGVKTAMRTAVHRTSGFSASAETVFSELQKLQTLQKVAAPWASFVQVQPNQDTFWKAGIDYAFRFRVFGFLPLGIHRIHVVRFGLSEGIYTEERNDLPRECLKSKEEQHTYGKCRSEGPPVGPLYPFVVSCAEVEAPDRLAALRYAYGKRYHYHIALLRDP